MTFLEKAKTKFPKMEERTFLKECPEDFNLETESKCAEGGCIKCWNREMPNTEQKEDEDKEWLDGYEKGKIDGLNDAWELVKNCWNMSVLDTREIFGYEYVKGILDNFTPQEALAKLKAYEEAQKIQVGDVLEYEDGDVLSVVLKVWGEQNLYMLFSDGSAGVHPREGYKKTGKHIDIQSILEQIGE